MSRAAHGARLAVAPLAAALCAASAAAQEDALCGDCHTTGRVDFEIPRPVLDAEEGVISCSEVVADAEVNHGLDYRPCPRCKAPTLRAEVQLAYDEDLKGRLGWLDERRGIDRFLDDPRRLVLMHCATEHFELAFSIPKVKVGRIVLDQHEAMHLYARRLEEAYRLYLDTFGLSHDVDQNGVRHTVMLFESAKHANKAQPKYCGIGGSGATAGVKLMGNVSVFVAWWDKTENRDDTEFHEYVVHNMAHLFLCSYHNYFWLMRKNGWIDEGLSHYFTDRIFAECRTHCFQEQDEAANWILSKWRPEVRKRVAAGEIPIFAEMIVKHGETLTSEEHLFVWSWTQYLIDVHGPGPFMQLVRGLKEQIPLRDLLEQHYGVSPFQFIEHWKQHVIETYPPR